MGMRQHQLPRRLEILVYPSVSYSYSHFLWRLPPHALRQPAYYLVHCTMERYIAAGKLKSALKRLDAEGLWQYTSPKRLRDVGSKGLTATKSTGMITLSLPSKGLQYEVQRHPQKPEELSQRPLVSCVLKSTHYSEIETVHETYPYHSPICCASNQQSPMMLIGWGKSHRTQQMANSS